MERRQYDPDAPTLGALRDDPATPWRVRQGLDRLTEYVAHGPDPADLAAVFEAVGAAVLNTAALADSIVRAESERSLPPEGFEADDRGAWRRA